MNKLKKAMDMMNVNKMLKKLYNTAKDVLVQAQAKEGGDMGKLVREMRMFFGPSRQFQTCFKSVLVSSVYWNQSCELDDKKFYIQKEPLFNQIVVNMVLGQYVSLKKKARIIIHDSCVLIGVPDEAGVLEEGQVFVQIRPDSFVVRDSVAETELKKVNKNYKYLEGKQEQRVILGDVLVTKNPCSHPGDI